MSASVWAQQPDPGPAPALDSLRSIPVPGTIAIQPRILSAYGALVAASMLSLLYLYRGRPFIIYWIGSWLSLSGALGLASRQYRDPVLDTFVTGLAILLVVWSAAAVLVAAHTFPNPQLPWRTIALRLAGSAAWFIVGPFVLPARSVLAAGMVVTALLLGWAAARYLRLARRLGYTGAFLMAAGLFLLSAGNAVGETIAFTVGGVEAMMTRLAAVNVVTSLFVALGMHLLVFEDMTQELRLTNRDLAAANEEVKRLAITDPLTGCHNRRFFDEIERREVQRHLRYASPLSVVFVDVNRFKLLNDSLGHDRGDETLRTLGALLRRQVRESDYVIRWGGDEFLLLLTCTRSEADAKALELKAAFAREREEAALPDYVGLSIGIVEVAKGVETLHDAIREADTRMYDDKTAERQAVQGPFEPRSPGAVS